MEAKKQRHIKSGAQYEHLFPNASVGTHTIQKDAGVDDTVAFIPEVVNKTLEQTKGIAGVLKGRSEYETCSNTWQFVYNHIAYSKDKDGYEQIRSPARSWHDRRSGVDCDCYATFISSILTNLGIKHKLRITKYSRDYFQHIYPVAQLSNGRAVAIDCVTDKFDYEVPFSEKKDYPMDLQYLNGLDDVGYTDSYLLDGSDDMDELGKLFKKKSSTGGKKNGGGIFKKIGNAAKKVGKGIKKVNLKKVLNVVNKVNPATVALRNGVLASMKLNIGNVARRMRWSYLTTDQAKAKKMDMGRWQKLVQARQKLEKIFYGAGGKPENLKKAILQGKGNKDKAVHGFDGFGRLYDHSGTAMYANRSAVPHNAHERFPVRSGHTIHSMHPDHPVNRMNRHTPLRQLLGDDIFFSENSIQGLGELGDPVSLTMITAASGVIAAIASTLKKIGDIFGGKGAGAKDFDEKTNADAEKEIPAGDGTSTDPSADTTTDDKGSSSSPGGSPDDTGGDNGGSSKNGNNSGGNSGGSSSSSGGSGGGSSSGGADNTTEDGGSAGGASKAVAKQTTDDGGADGESKGAGGGGKEGPVKDGFWGKNKKWIVPAGIGVAGISILAVAAHAMKAVPPAVAAPHKKPLHGTPHHKKKHHPKKTKATKHKISAKALL
jgi:uncharacterized membrane protein YgcG